MPKQQTTDGFPRDAGLLEESTRMGLSLSLLVAAVPFFDPYSKCDNIIMCFCDSFLPKFLRSTIVDYITFTFIDDR